MFPGDVQPSPEPQELAGPAGSASAQAGTGYQQALHPWLEGVTGMALGPQSWERIVLKSGLPCLLQDALMRAEGRTEESGWSKFSPLPSQGHPDNLFRAVPACHHCQPGLFSGSGSKALGWWSGGQTKPQLCFQTDVGSKPSPPIPGYWTLCCSLHSGECRLSPVNGLLTHVPGIVLTQSSRQQT